VFLRSRSRGRETWGLWILGLGLCLISVLGLTGVFGELRTGRGTSIILFGVPLGLFAIGLGVANAIRGWGDPGEEEVDDPEHVGDRAGLPDAAEPDAVGAETDGADRERPGPDRPAPDGMIDR
jgi:hypothetical protein